MMDELRNQNIALSPIVGPIDYGVDVSDTEEMEVIKAEIEKQSSIENKRIDWNVVLEKSKQILDTKSKDLSIASYWAMALLQGGQYKSFDEAAKTICMYVEGHWDSVFPKRERAKLSSLKWLGQEIEKWIASERQLKKEDVEALVSSFNELATVVGKRVSEAGDSISVAKNSLVKKLATQTAPISDIGKKEESKSNTGVSVSRSATEITTEQDLNVALQQLRDISGHIAKYYRDANLKNPQSYRFNRISAWGTLNRLPENKDGKTSVLPPQPSQDAKIKELLKEKKREALVIELEANLRRNPWWIKGQKILWDTLNEMGDDFKGARDVVEEELNNFLNKNKKISDLRYGNGDPIVDNDTKAWIQEKIEKTSTSASTITVDIDADETVMSAIDNAARIFEANGIVAAVESVEKAKKAETTHRNRLKLEVEIIKYLARAGIAEVTINRVEALMDELESLKVSDWEDELVNQISHLLIVNYDKAISNDKQNQQRYSSRLQSCFRRLCKNNVGDAMKIVSQENIKRFL